MESLCVMVWGLEPVKNSSAAAAVAAAAAAVAPGWEWQGSELA